MTLNRFNSRTHWSSPGGLFPSPGRTLLPFALHVTLGKTPWTSAFLHPSLSSITPQCHVVLSLRLCIST